MSKSMKQKIFEMKGKISSHSLKQNILGLALFAAGGLAAGFAEKEHKAVEKYENQITQVLNTMGVESIEDINTPDSFGRLPTMKAKSPAEMKLLIALGADVNATDDIGCNAINYILNNRYDVVDKKVTKTAKVKGLALDYVTQYNNGSVRHSIQSSMPEREFRNETKTDWDSIEYTKKSPKTDWNSIEDNQWKPNVTSVQDKEFAYPKLDEEIAYPKFEKAMLEERTIEYTDIERQHVQRNTNSAIQNDAECIALLLQAGVKIQTNYSDGRPIQYTDIQKEILEKAGNIAGMNDYVENALQITRALNKVTTLHKNGDVWRYSEKQTPVKSTARLDATPKTISWAEGLKLQAEQGQKPSFNKSPRKSKRESR